MKKMIFLSIIAVFICMPAFSQSAGSTMYVAVKTVDLKSATGAFASNVGALKMGDSVTVLAVNGKWVQVRAQNSLSGWAALSSLSSKRVVSSGVSASAKEVSLAGKGFNETTEIEYKKTGLNYSFVDQMETINIPGAELLKFIQDGRLSKGE